MDQADVPPTPQISLFDRLRLKITGVDGPTLQLCPQRDWDAVRALAEIMIASFLYQAGLFSVIAHRLFEKTGKIRVEFLLISIFLGGFILQVDAFVVMRSGWFLAGIRELLRGGIDISGGFGVRIKANVFLIVRIFLSICIAQLTAIFLSLLIFESDITARIHASYVHSNTELIAAAARRVDADISRATDALNAENARVSALAFQVNALRQDQIDPSTNRPEIQQAQQELAQLLSEKTKAEEAVRDREAFASNEMAGIRGSEQNSGIPGDGPRRRAAMEAVNDAKDNAKQISTALDAARHRIDELRKQLVSSDQTSKQHSNDELPRFETTLAAEDGKLHVLQDQLALLTKHRDDAIRDAVQHALNHLPVDDGFLAQISALEHIAQADPKIAAVIILIDMTSFGFELAAVLAKVFAYVPTTYAALLARDSYIGVVRLVDEMMVELNRGAGDKKIDAEAEFDPPAAPPYETPHNMNATPETNPFANIVEPPSSPPKRPRGRPRKTPAGEPGRNVVALPTNWNPPQK